MIDTVFATLDPDAVELEFVFQPDGQNYRGRFQRNQPAAVRAVRKVRDMRVEDGTLLAAPFQVDGVLTGALLLQRRARRPWTGAERMRFELLRPFVAQLLSASARSEMDGQARRWLMAAADRADAPIMLFDAAGSILFANEAADDLLSNQTEQGLAVLAEDRRLMPLLSHLIRLACGSPSARRERLALTNGRSLEARITPVTEVDGVPGEACIRLVTLHERAALTIDDVRPHLHTRGISDREADVVGSVLQGMRNAEIADELCISEYTVKDHLKHIFHKLGVTSRGGLIRALYAARPCAGREEVRAGAPVSA